MSSNNYHHGSLSTAVLAEATVMSAEKGIDSVSTREIARKLNVSATAIYRHYANREALIDAVRYQSMLSLSNYMTRELKIVRSKSSADNERDLTLDELRGIGQGYIKFGLQQPGLFAAALSCDETDDIPFDESPYCILQSIVQRLADQGYIASVAVPTVCATLWSLVHGIAILLIDDMLPIQNDDERQLFIDEALTIAINGISAKID